MAAIIILLVTADKIIAIVTSPGDKGAYNMSTIEPSIFLIIKDDAECEKACCITCIAINPGARKFINETPKIFPLSLPMAKDKTDKNKREVTIGEKIVCIQTAKNLRTSFL